MQARVVVKRMPYVTEPSPPKRTNLLRSVTSCKKLNKSKAFRFDEFYQVKLFTLTCFCHLQKMYPAPISFRQSHPTALTHH